MAPTLYMTVASPGVRAVLITAKAIGLTLNEKNVELTKGEHKTPEYLKLNPQHTVPTLVDEDGFAVWDSHAIITYLVSKYAKDDSLYPENLKERAVVDQRLHFEAGVLFNALKTIVFGLLFEGKTEINQKDRENVEAGYEFLEAFLEGKKWIAGDSLTVADFSTLSTVSSLNYLVPIDGKKFSRVEAWFKKASALPVAEVNKKGLEVHIKFMEARLKSC